MVRQRDLDIAIQELNNCDPEVLSLYAYAALTLLKEKMPAAFVDESIKLSITDTPVYSSLLEREVPREKIIGISVYEWIDCNKISV